MATLADLTSRIGEKRDVLLLALLTIGCQPRPEEWAPFPGYTQIQASHDCPPVGGGAISIVFRPAPADSFEAMGPQLRIAIWRDVRSLEGRTFTSIDRPSTGGGYMCGDSTTCLPLRTWWIRFSSVGSDSSLGGELEVQGGDGEVKRGQFQARWYPRSVFCI